MWNIYELSERTPEMLRRLAAVWEDSVRGSHDFLSDPEVADIRRFVPQALEGVAHLVVAEEEPGNPGAFLGVEGDRLEMLFLSSAERGKSLGRQLLEYAMDRYGVRELTVNEQNPQAAEFYRHMGFQTYKRTDEDEQGNPYPLLYMRRE